VPDVAAIKSILAPHNLRVGRTDRERNPRVIDAVGALREIYRPRETGPDDLRWVIDVAMRSWGDDPERLRHGLKAVVMKGLVTMRARYRTTPGFDTEHLIRRLKGTSPQTIAAGAKNIRQDALAAGGSGGLRANPTQCFAKALYYTYNERLGLVARGGRPAALPEWGAVGERRSSGAGR
jgi:hypothetical protein